MTSVPPLYDQVREGSARAGARARALARLGRPSYALAAAAGILFGIGSALVEFLDRALPSLMPHAPFTLNQMLAAMPGRAVIGGALAVTGAAVLRFARWAYFRARFGAQAT